MSGDLYYFYESDMNESSLKTFLDSLPPRPQNIFRRSVNCYVNRMNVLQGYRGPSHMRNGDSGDSEVLNESHGLQEIRFWYGTTKLTNLVPGYGTLMYGAVRIAQKAKGQLEWSSLYFDSKTGECLSHDEDEAAEKLNKIGLKLLKEGKYSEAAEYHDNAYRACSRGYRNERTFKNNAKKAKSKLAEKSSNYDTGGCDSRRSSRQSTASSSNNDSDDDDDFRYDTYREDRSRQSRRMDDTWDTNLRYETYEPDWFYEGQISFDRGDYRIAEYNFERALRSFRSSGSEQMCYAGIMAAQAEQRAIQLNSEGDSHFRQGDYAEAERKYQQAHGESRVSERRQVYKDNLDKAEAEVEAQILNREGNVHFQRGEFDEALNNYQEAHRTSKLIKEYHDYLVNVGKATNEIDATQLNYEGNKFFRRGKYEDAIIKYRQAYNKSQVNSRRKIYATNRTKAQVEIEAAKLNSEGDSSFQQGNHIQAQSKYQQASVKSQDIAKKNLYTANTEKAQTVINKLTMLDALWQRAWDAENDENDRSEEARQCFEELLRESNDCLRRFPDVQRFKQYEILVTLKIEGNEIFNQGLESQLTGTTLFQEALELKQQEKYERANVKFLEAKTKFLEAQQKFRTGSESDPRFKSCVEYVQENINEVRDSVKIIEECILSSRLSKLDTNASSANHSGATYYAHI